jgi:hypothetical protein
MVKYLNASRYQDKASEKSGAFFMLEKVKYNSVQYTNLLLSMKTGSNTVRLKTILGLEYLKTKMLKMNILVFFSIKILKIL